MGTETVYYWKNLDLWEGFMKFQNIYFFHENTINNPCRYTALMMNTRMTIMHIQPGLTLQRLEN